MLENKWEKCPRRSGGQFDGGRCEVLFIRLIIASAFESRFAPNHAGECNHIGGMITVSIT